MTTEPVDTCAEVQSAIVSRRGELEESESGHLTVCENCREFAAFQAELRTDLTAYREEILDPLAADFAARRPSRRLLLELAGEEVEERFRATSLAGRLRRRIGDLGAAWRQLCLESRAFRFLTQGGAAIGLGLILAVALDQGGEGTRVHATPPSPNTPVDFAAPSVAMPSLPPDEVGPNERPGKGGLDEPVKRRK